MSLTRDYRICPERQVRWRRGCSISRTGRQIVSTVRKVNGEGRNVQSNQ
jgi:hypothetical protein